MQLTNTKFCASSLASINQFFFCMARILPILHCMCVVKKNNNIILRIKIDQVLDRIRKKEKFVEESEEEKSSDDRVIVLKKNNINFPIYLIEILT